jgi:hypothetical protein
MRVGYEDLEFLLICWNAIKYKEKVLAKWVAKCEYRE